MELNGLKFKSTNLTELRDESFYMKLKEETQCEFLLLVFVYNIVRFHLSFMIRDEYDEQIKYLKAQGIGEDCLRKIIYEVEGFKKFIKLEKNRDRFIKINTPAIFNSRHPLIMNSLYFYNMFKLYDESFNNIIILQNLCGFELDIDKYYSIILYFIDKTAILRDTLDPSVNNRAIIIKNFHLYTNNNVASNKFILPFKIAPDIQYILDCDISDDFFYNFDDRFKIYIMNKKWDDGYNFYWKEHIKHEATDEVVNKKAYSTCLKYLVEILDKDNQQIISMTVTKTKDSSLPNKQLHYFIKKNVISDIKSIIMKLPPYRNVSLLLHSFAAWQFNAESVYSDLMASMRNIFKKNGIIIESYLDDPDGFLVQDFAQMCVLRSAMERIIITDEFRNMWHGSYKIKNELIMDYIKIFQLVLSEDSIKNKYLKYKKKYILLKNTFNK
jgi:hypothetical protein